MTIGEIPEVSQSGLKEILYEMHAKSAEGFELVEEYCVSKDGSTKERMDRLFEDSQLIARVLDKVLPLRPLESWSLRTLIVQESPPEEVVEVIAAGPH